MSRLTRKSVIRVEVVLILLATLIVTLSNPTAISIETAILLVGVLMIAIASFAGL
jgi:hypothetical protein